MSTTIDQAFITQFESDVFIAYQRMGSKIRGTVRTKNNVVGNTDRFQKVGKGSASTKSRHGLVPTMNAVHSYAEVTLADYYAGDYVDKLDLLKTNIDERQIAVNAGAYALGRKTDDILTTAMDASSDSTSFGSTGFDQAAVLALFLTFNTNDIPDDGNRFAVVSALQWNKLLGITAFTSADYVGYDNAPWATGLTAKRWMGINWYMHNGLPISSTTRSNFGYHKTAVGHAIGCDIETDITWQGTRAAWFINNMMSMGAVVIDSTGVFKRTTTE